MEKAYFEWNEEKDRGNRKKHDVTFYKAQRAFLDPRRVIAKDLDHSHSEQRYYCFGKVNANVMTVRFTYRANRIRIISVGYWRKGRKIYEKAQN